MNTRTIDDYMVSMESEHLTPYHLELHKQIFNPNTKPDYFSYLEEKFDLVYRDTILAHNNEFVKAQETQDQIMRNQEETGGRMTANPKSDQIGTSLKKSGLDIREKPGLGYYLQDELYLFGGNTVYEQLAAYANFSERFVAIFELKSTERYSSVMEAGRAAGTWTNLIGYPYADASKEDVEALLVSMKFHPDNFDEEFDEEWKKLGCDKKFADGAKIRIANKCRFNAGGEKVLSPPSSEQVLIDIRKNCPGKYEDDYENATVFKVFSCESYPDKYLTYTRRTYEFLLEKLNYNIPRDELRYNEVSNVKQNIIMYFGKLGGDNPAKNLIDTHIKKYKEFLQNVRVAEQIPFSNGSYDPEIGYEPSKFTHRAQPMGVYVQCTGLEKYGYKLGTVIPIENLFKIQKKMKSEKLAAEEKARAKLVGSSLDEYFLNGNDNDDVDIEEAAD